MGRATVGLVVLLAACSTQASTTSAPLPPAPATAAPAVSTPVGDTAAVNRAEEDGALAGVSGVIRLTEGAEERAESWGLLDPSGNYFGPTDPSGQILWLEPIEGYGDFSDTTIEQRWDMDPQLVPTLIETCLADLDSRFADLIARTGGFSWDAFTGQLRQVAFAAFIACQSGLRLPRLTHNEWTDPMWAEAYAYHLAWIDCIEHEAGLSWGDRIGFDTWKANATAYPFPPDHPYTNLDPTTLQRIQTACPVGPPGGFGAWDPGDLVGLP